MIAEFPKKRPKLLSSIGINVIKVRKLIILVKACVKRCRSAVGDFAMCHVYKRGNMEVTSFGRIKI